MYVTYHVVTAVNHLKPFGMVRLQIYITYILFLKFDAYPERWCNFAFYLSFEHAST